MDIRIWCRLKEEFSIKGEWLEAEHTSIKILRQEKALAELKCSTLDGHKYGKDWEGGLPKFTSKP